MDAQSLCCGIIALLPLLYYMVKSHWHIQNGLRLPPGPWQFPIIGSLHHMLGAASVPHRRMRDLSCRYGPLMFLRFCEVPVIIVSSREAAIEVMKTHDAIFATRPQTKIIKILTKRGQAVVMSPYGEHWLQIRKLCIVELLSPKHVLSLQHVREEEATRLVWNISSASSPFVNLSELLVESIADMTMHAIMGYRLRDRDSLLTHINNAIRVAGGFSLADLFPSSRLAGALSLMARKAEVYSADTYAFMDHAISEHKARRSHEEAVRGGLIDVLLRIQSQGSPQYSLTMGSIKTVIFDLFSGASETAATTVQWVMAELMRNPTVMFRAQSEVREEFMGQTNVTEEGITKLGYLHWVVAETLRLHPSTPLLLPRECREKCQVMGYDVPKGAMVLVNAWAISRDPRYWDEPETFNPARFERDSRDYKGNNFEFTPFGAGRRICPGISFGLANVKVTLANLLFYFDWSIPEDGVHPSELDMSETMRITAKRKKDLWLRATARAPLPK
ncbi:unnamed protein product [Urochloa humidicola]